MGISDDPASKIRGGLKPKGNSCDLRFSAWLVSIIFLATASAPSLNRIIYPQLPDILVFLLIPLGAFHIAGRTRSNWVFGVFGMICSVPFFGFYLDQNCSFDPFGTGPSEWMLGVISSLFVIGVGLLARGAAKLRHRCMDLKRDPRFCRVCKYDLTGNVSGVCPECGTAIDENTESPHANGKT